MPSNQNNVFVLHHKQSRTSDRVRLTKYSKNKKDTGKGWLKDIVWMEAPGHGLLDIPERKFSILDGCKNVSDRISNETKT